jgi:predicted nucleic acid-binding protein
MNGTNTEKNKSRIVLDTNAAIFLLTEKDMSKELQRQLNNATLYISVITKIELYAKQGLPPAEIQKIGDFISEISVSPLEEPVVDITIAIRQSNPNIKLPDAIIAATAVALKALLLTDDSRLLKLSFPGFSAQTVS